MDELPFGKRKQLRVPKRTKNKYGAVKARSVLTKRWYDSKAERDFRNWLFAREQWGEVRDIQEQVTIELDSGIKWKCDFLYFDIKRDGELYAEVKGAETERFRMVKKLWLYHGPGLLQIWKRRGADKPFVVAQEIMPFI